MECPLITHSWHGHRKRDFSQTGWWKEWNTLLPQIGLDLILPIVGVSEATAVNIVKNGNLGGNSEFMSTAKHPGCGRCWKCFHKNGMLGHPYDINSREIQKFLNQRPVRTSTHALWWVNQQNHWDQLPDLLHLKEKDFSWWIQYYPPAFELLPEWIVLKYKQKLESMIEPIPQDSPFHSWNLFPDAP